MLRDLGAINQPLLVFGGAYSNAQALGALLARAAQMGFADDQLIHTGDVAAYGAAPQACADLLRSRGIAAIAGNVELALAKGADDCGCGFEDGSTCDRLSRGWFPFAQANIDAAARDWMAGLPQMLRFTHFGRRVVVIHGGVRDVADFIWPSDADARFEAEIAMLEPVDIVLAGHCGLAFQRRIGAVDWLNAGVIGLPPNDGSPATRFGVLDAQGFTLHDLSYDHQAAALAMREVGLTQGYDRALQSGYWPSEDILPPVLRRSA